MPKPPSPPVMRWTPSDETWKSDLRSTTMLPGFGGAMTIFPTCPDCCISRERVRDLVGGERLERQGLEAAFREQGHHLSEQTRPVLALMLEHLIEIDAEIGEVPAERAQADMGVGDIVALAQLDEATERLQAVQAAFHRFAEQAVHHDADPVTRDPADLVDEGEGAGIEDVLGPREPSPAHASRATRRWR